MSDNPLIDVATLAELKETAGADFVDELAQTFAEEAPGLLASLRTARAQGDADTFRRAAHSLKSNSHTFGAVQLGALARALELGGLSADPAQDLAAIDKLTALCGHTMAALKELGDG
ncbi:MAG TPA: Hpt domain-containing protein [Rubrivivax sp.]|jgi:HPt (histidine-containing phosphotransfer) domain-containing protein|nr:Hpt domain-containing protein [Rubrivivax sp.]